ALGEATVSVFAGPDLVAAGPFRIVPTAPPLFTFSAAGRGPPAAPEALNLPPAAIYTPPATRVPNFFAAFSACLCARVAHGGGAISASVRVFIDGNPATVTYAGQAPSSVGANQVNVQFPAGITSGAHTLTISRDGVTSNVVTIAIK